MLANAATSGHGLAQRLAPLQLVRNLLESHALWTRPQADSLQPPLPLAQLSLDATGSSQLASGSQNHADPLGCFTSTPDFDAAEEHAYIVGDFGHASANTLIDHPRQESHMEWHRFLARWLEGMVLQPRRREARSTEARLTVPFGQQEAGVPRPCPESDNRLWLDQLDLIDEMRLNRVLNCQTSLPRGQSHVRLVVERPFHRLNEEEARIHEPVDGLPRVPIKAIGPSGENRQEQAAHCVGVIWLPETIGSRRSFAEKEYRPRTWRAKRAGRSWGRAVAEAFITAASALIEIDPQAGERLLHSVCISLSILDSNDFAVPFTGVVKAA